MIRLAQSMLYRVGFLFFTDPHFGGKMNYFKKLKEIKTLLVDDDDLIRDSLSLAFNNQGCFLQTAETAEEGMQTIQRDSFDLIISDLRLPGKDGLEFLRAARSYQPNTLCVLITAYGDKHIFSDATALGIHDFIEKPFSIESLVQSLALLIEEQK
jgi:DNA-binding NtrC family response regulator